MIPRGSRFALWSIALLLCLSFYCKGRTPAPKGEGAAFSLPGTGSMVVRLAGDLPRPGLYRFPEGTAAADAIKMTLPGRQLTAVSTEGAGRPLCPGDLVTVTVNGRQPPRYSVGRMAAGERMLIGIPLDPNELSAAEWEALPGIGPALAGRIVADRQTNGAFSSLDGLLRVPGIGPGKLAALRKFFAESVNAR